MTTKIREFFTEYEKGTNTFEPELVSSQFAEAFMGADPSGAVCIRNDASLRDVIQQRATFFRQIGFKSAQILDVVETPLDDRYTIAKVHWQMIFEKDPGQPLEFKFFFTYLLFDSPAGLKIVFYLAHDDEREVMREAGLLPNA